MEQDEINKILQRADRLQEQLNDAFKRENTNPVYHTPDAINTAISGCLRFFPEDRKNEVGEIFYAMLNVLYESVDNGERTKAYCNPLVGVEPTSNAHFPQLEMLMRVMMPLSWALELRWLQPGMESSYDENLQAYSEDEAKVISEAVDFLFETFPEICSAQTEEFQAYWQNFASDRALMHLETSEEKDVVKSVLLKKREEFMKRQKEANK